MTLSSISLNLSKHWRFLAFWEFSIVSSLSWYSILVQHTCDDRAWPPSECSPRYDNFGTAEDVSAFGQQRKFPPYARKTSGTQVIVSTECEFICSIRVSAKCDCQTQILQMNPLVLKKKYHPCLCSFIRLRARYFPMTSCKDLLLITKKIEMTFHSIMESISHLRKMARTSAKSENPNP